MRARNCPRVWIAMCLAVSLASAALAPAHAGDGAVTVGGSGVVRTVDPYRWWGNLGAIACGLGGRLAMRAPHIGMNPWVLAPTIGGCLLALVDVVTTR